MLPPKPVLSKVKVLPRLAITNELLLLNVKVPTDSLAFKLTVLKAVLWPSVAVFPATPGTFGLLLQLVPADQLPSILFVQVLVSAAGFGTIVNCKFPPLQPKE